MKALKRVVDAMLVRKQKPFVPIVNPQEISNK
jgi:hypothetical protein